MEISVVTRWIFSGVIIKSNLYIKIEQTKNFHHGNKVDNLLTTLQSGFFYVKTIAHNNSTTKIRENLVCVTKKQKQD